MIISISGEAGSGKSTLAKRLAEELGWPRIYVGGIRRAMAEEMGMTLNEFNIWSEENPEGDIPVDKRAQEEARSHENVIAEGRTMFHFLPESVKIYVDVDLDEAARRVYKDVTEGKRDEATNMLTVEDVKENLQQRKLSDQKRYKKYYDIDVFDHGHYDLILDSTNMTIDEVFQEAMEYIQEIRK